MPKKKETLLKTTIAVTLLIFVSKAGGFLREIIMTAYFGAGAEMDAYNMAYSLYYVPVLLFNSCITSTIVPIYVQLRQERKPRLLNNFSSNVVNLFAFAAIVISILMYFLAGPLVSLTAHGFDAEKQLLTAHLLQKMLPSLAFLVVSIVLSSILNAREKYMAAQLTGFPLTVVLITATIGFSNSLGVKALAWGVLISGVLQVAILLPALKGVMRYHLRFDTKDEHFRRLLILAGPAVLSMAVNELNHMIDKMLASTLPDGHLSCMNLAYRLIAFLIGVVLVPLETIVFSKMSMRTASHDKRGVKDIIMKCTEVIALVILPVTAIGAIMSKDVIRLVYLHGKFSEASVPIAATALLFYIIGVFGYGMRDILNRAFHACQDTKTPMLSSFLTVVLNVVLNVILVRFMGVGGLALATSISAFAGAASLFVLLRKKLGRMHGRETLDQLLRIGIATVCCAFVCLIMNRILPPASGTLATLMRLIAATGASAVVYVALTMMMQVRQVDLLRTIIRGRLKRR